MDNVTFLQAMLRRPIALLVVCSSLAFCADDPPTTAKPPEKVPVRREVVVVTGVFEPLPLDEVDRAVTAFPTREQPLLFPNGVDYLEQDPSLDLRARAPGGIQTDLSIRGADFSQTLVLVNGLRVNDAQSGHHNLDQPLPMGSLERIEVLRGAGSTLYGADGLGGAVNFITAPPAVSEFRLGAAFGNFGINQQSGSAAYASKRFSEQLTFERDFSTGFMADRDYRNLETASDTHLKTALGSTSLMLSYGDRPFGANNFYGAADSWERTKGWFAGLTQDLGNNTQAAFGFRRHTDEFVWLREDPAVYTNNHETQSWEYALRRHDKLSQNGTLSYGAEGYRDSIDSTNLSLNASGSPVLNPALGTHARNQAAVYANFDMRALRRFSFSVGAREQAYSGLRTNFNPTVSAGYWLSSKFKLRASAGRAFRLPTYTDLYYADPITVGNPNLKPESAWSYDGGLDWYSGGRLSGGVTVFDRRLRNGIDYALAADGRWHATNIDNLNFIGVETAFHLRLPNQQQVDFAYTGIHANRDSSMADVPTRYLFNYLADNGSVGWQGRLPGNIMGRTRLGVCERRGLDPYALWDVSLTRAFSRVSPFLQLSNLTDTQYADITVPARVPMPGRSVVGGVSVLIFGQGK